MTSPEKPPPPASGTDGTAVGRSGPSAAGAPTAPADRGAAKGTALALLVTVAVVGAACLITVQTCADSARTAVAWGTGVAGTVLCAAVAVAVHARLTSLALRAQVAAAQAGAVERDAADARFADTTVPGVVERLRHGASAETALAEAPPVDSETQRRVLATLTREVHRGETLRAAAMSACANAAGRVQALATGMAADLREMEHRHADEDVLGDLLHLDHRNAQTGRIADSLAVLTGARSGRRWAKPIVMESVLRGAMGRISGYQRVRLHSTSEAAVAGHAAEGVMHALAELMDNAANFSPPTSEVHVYVEEVAAGIVITVEDGGLVMGDVALRRAEQAVSGEQGDLSALSGTRLGLAVVGRLARKHGLQVSFRPSAHGGTGVLLRVPHELVTEPRHEERSPVSAPAATVPPAPRAERNSRQRPARPEGGTTAVHSRQPEPAGPDAQRSPGHGRQEDTARTTPEPPPQEFGESGLPKRRRGQTLAAVARASATSSRLSEPAPDTEQRDPAAADQTADGPAAARGTRRPSGARFGDFRRAVQGAGTEDTGRRSRPSDSSPTRSSSLSEDDTE
ncbi:ATP-binding protein [Streptomyces sp. NPDC007083]|uniref:sensor histidine kinase n=1 Tax=unclassified Streptomyces TaxID=2593676 RepID=UPI003401A966